MAEECEPSVAKANELGILSTSYCKLRLKVTKKQGIDQVKMVVFDAGL